MHDSVVGSGKRKIGLETRIAGEISRFSSTKEWANLALDC